MGPQEDPAQTAPAQTAPAIPPQSVNERSASREGTVPPLASRTRSSATWTALVIGTILLIVMLVFILQNLHSARVSFFVFHWRIPIGLDLLLAAVLGAAIVLCAGAVRLLQIRLQARRHLKSERSGRSLGAGTTTRAS